MSYRSGKRMHKLYVLWVALGVCLLSAALTGCALFARKTPEVTPTLAPTSPPQPPSQTRVKEWVQTSAADFGTGEREGLAISDADGGELHLAAGAQTGVYTSTIVDAGMVFNAIVPRWQVDTPADASMQIEVRVYSAGQGWSAWVAFPDATMDPEGKQYSPETPLMLLGGERFQYRATLASTADQGSPVLREITLIYMDTSVGPTTIQAKAFTTMGQPARGVPQPAVISREGWDQRLYGRAGCPVGARHLLLSRRDPRVGGYRLQLPGGPLWQHLPGTLWRTGCDCRARLQL